MAILAERAERHEFAPAAVLRVGAVHRRREKTVVFGVDPQHRGRRSAGRHSARSTPAPKCIAATLGIGTSYQASWGKGTSGRPAACHALRPPRYQRTLR